MKQIRNCTAEVEREICESRRIETRTEIESGEGKCHCVLRTRRRDVDTSIVSREMSS